MYFVKNKFVFKCFRKDSKILIFVEYSNDYIHSKLTKLQLNHNEYFTF